MAHPLLSERHYDLVFMDIQMPVMNGVEALHAIRASEQEAELQPVPIIVLTADALKTKQENITCGSCKM